MAAAAQVAANGSGGIIFLISKLVRDKKTEFIPSNS